MDWLCHRVTVEVELAVDLENSNDKRASTSDHIAIGKMRYPNNIFLISPQKHMLYVLIISPSHLDEVLLVSTHHNFLVEK